MSEEKQSTNTETTPLFENKFVFVSEDGELILKKTSLFEQRVLAQADPESVEAQVEAFENAFENLQTKVDGFFENVSKEDAPDADELKASFDKLTGELLEAEAVGDFESLINSSKERLESLLAPAEKETADKEEDESADDEPEDAADTETIEIEVEKETKPSEADDTAQSDKKDSEKEKEVDKAAADEPEDAGDTQTVERETEMDEVEEETKPAETDESAEAEKEVAEEKKDLSETETYYKELADKAEQLVEVSDWAYVSMEFDNIDNAWGEGPDPAGEEEDEAIDISGYREKIDQLREDFEQKKKAHYEEQKRKREENLEKKKQILASLKKIVDDEEWTATREVGKLKGRWDRIKAVPADAAEDLEKKFSSLLSTFDDHKVDRLVKKKQQEEDNLTGKLVILEKMEKFVKELDETSDWDEMEKSFEQLAKQFRKIGRVPVEKNQEVWSQYHRLQDTFHSMRFKHDKSYRNKIEKHLGRKKKLIDEAEALIDAEDLAEAARKVNKLHRRWKKAGNLPQKDENELWDRFKAATDKFNDKKSDNLDLLREQEQENLEEKHALIEKAENLKDSEDWEQTHKDLQNLMEKWKKVGPVPKRSSGKIWKKFKGAMDHFYDRRRDHFKEVKEERKDNLKEKEEVLEKLRELRDHEDPIEAVNIAKPLQTEFKKAGYVPIKHKNRMWKEYREICDVIYDRFRAAKAAVQVVGQENVENFSVDDIADIRKLNSQASSLRKQITKMEQELIQKKESLSYFKPSGGSNPLLDDVKKKIEKSEEEIAEKEDKLAEIEKKIDLIKKEGEE
ncbi:DUF349 domain-containing protein [Rhodohalobacter sp. SW132]|uniref:DUF349 domain-containing protein n=1 Tax=Rhodohalobacter sp. SW132 TaxID=2293433 RepID=UPI000E277D8E|nr:DUF349 domain-containing protein [Rhodohalobacter sp. SW132]REL24773.1 DUF349 domain-containing protein [Rhodohalobacter sp. SW132]